MNFGQDVVLISDNSSEVAYRPAAKGLEGRRTRYKFSSAGGYWVSLRMYRYASLPGFLWCSGGWGPPKNGKNGPQDR